MVASVKARSSKLLLRSPSKMRFASFNRCCASQRSSAEVFMPHHICTAMWVGVDGLLRDDAQQSQTAQSNGN